jgi:hypothetical protein
MLRDSPTSSARSAACFIDRSSSSCLDAPSRRESVPPALHQSSYPFSAFTSAIPSRASSSARSLRSCPECPRTQRQCTVWCLTAASRRCHQVGVLDQLLVGGAPAVLLPATGSAARRRSTTSISLGLSLRTWGKPPDFAPYENYTKPLNLLVILWPLACCYFYRATYRYVVRDRRPKVEPVDHVIVNSLVT